MIRNTKTVGEILNEIAELQARFAVYRDLCDHLTQFLGSDSHQPTRGIKSLAGPAQAVSEEVIEQVQLELRDVLKKIELQIGNCKARTLMGSTKQTRQIKKPTTRRKKSVPKRKKTTSKRKAS